MSARTEIAEAASTVEGVKVTPYYRQGMKTGDGFVHFLSMAPDEDGEQLTTWEVWVVAGQNVAAAEKWIESKVPLLLDALDRQFLAITSVLANDLGLTDQTTNGIVITGIREAD